MSAVDALANVRALPVPWTPALLFSPQNWSAVSFMYGDWSRDLAALVSSGVVPLRDLRKHAGAGLVLLFRDERATAGAREAAAAIAAAACPDEAFRRGRALLDANRAANHRLAFADAAGRTIGVLQAVRAATSAPAPATPTVAPPANAPAPAHAIPPTPEVEPLAPEHASALIAQLEARLRDVEAELARERQKCAQLEVVIAATGIISDSDDEPQPAQAPPPSPPLPPSPPRARRPTPCAIRFPGFDFDYAIRLAEAKHV